MSLWPIRWDITNFIALRRRRAVERNMATDDVYERRATAEWQLFLAKLNCAKHSIEFKLQKNIWNLKPGRAQHENFKNVINRKPIQWYLCYHRVHVRSRPWDAGQQGRKSETAAAVLRSTGQTCLLWITC